MIAQAEGLSPKDRVELVSALTGAVGFSGLVAGQALDLAERNRPRTVAEIDH